MDDGEWEERVKTSHVAHVVEEGDLPSPGPDYLEARQRRSVLLLYSFCGVDRAN